MKLHLVGAFCRPVFIDAQHDRAEGASRVRAIRKGFDVLVGVVFIFHTKSLAQEVAEVKRFFPNRHKKFCASDLIAARCAISAMFAEVSQAEQGFPRHQVHFIFHALTITQGRENARDFFAFYFLFLEKKIDIGTDHARNFIRLFIVSRLFSTSYGGRRGVPL